MNFEDELRVLNEHLARIEATDDKTSLGMCWTLLEKTISILYSVKNEVAAYNNGQRTQKELFANIEAVLNKIEPGV